MRIASNHMIFLASGLILFALFSMFFFLHSPVKIIYADGTSTVLVGESLEEASSMNENVIDLNNLIVVYDDENRDPELIEVNDPDELNLDELDQEEKEEAIKDLKDSLAEKAEELESQVGVDFVQPQYLYKLESWIQSGIKDTPNDFRTAPSSTSGHHWYYELSRVREMWHWMDCFKDQTFCGGSSNVTVAVIDTGLAYEARTNNFGLTFAANDDMFGAQNINLYTNSDETPFNGLDDDSNGYIDDYHGFNANYRVYCNLNSCTANQEAEEGNPNDDGGHGTYVSNIIATVVDNNSSVSGIVAPGFKLTVMPIKATFEDSGFLGTTQIVESITYARLNGADVINMSWGGTSLDKLVKDALDSAADDGLVLVAASGNDNRASLDFPAGYYNGQILDFDGPGGNPPETVNFDVIGVGAATRNNTRATYSNYGTALDVTAYVGNGSGISDAVYQRSMACFFTVNDCYDETSMTTFSSGFGWGTSFASPQVSSLAGLILSFRPSSTAVEVQNYIFNNSRDILTAGYDNQSGHGVINFEKTLLLVSSGIDPQIIVDEPNGTADGADNIYYYIQWRDFDFDTNAMIDFYWDTNNVGNDGHLISECSNLSEDSTTDYCQFYTLGIPDSDIYIYGCIDDGVNDITCDYSPGQISITHPGGILRESGKDVVSSAPKFIPFTEDFSFPPVVIPQITSEFDTQMAFLNITSVTADGFTIQIEENYRRGFDNVHGLAEVSWYALEDVNSEEEFGIARVTHEWKYVEFVDPYPSLEEVPMVLTFMQTNRNSDIAKSVIRNLTTTGFEVRIEEAAGFDGVHSIIEEVGWIAFKDNSSAQERITYSVNQNWQTVTFDTPFPEMPVLLIDAWTNSTQSLGTNQFLVDVRNLTTTGFQVRIEEDPLFDGIHKPEHLAWLAIPYGGPSEQNGFAFSVNHNWKQVAFNKPFGVIPMVFSDIITTSNSDTSDVDIRNVTSVGFEVKVEEDPQIWNKTALTEHLTFVAKTPENSLPEEVGVVSVNHNWVTVNFPNAFSSTPKVIADIQTENNPQTVTLDIRNVTTTSFEIRLEEDTLLGWDGTHTFEKVGWFAFDTPSVGSFGGTASVTHNWTPISFGTTFTNWPSLVFSSNTNNQPDPIIVEVRNVTTTGFEARVVEQTPYDEVHAAETVVWHAEE